MTRKLGIVRVFRLVLPAVLALWAPGGLQAETGGNGNGQRISEYPVYDTLLPGGIIKFGIETGFAYTRSLDLGMGLGGRISQRFIHPFFHLNSQVYFWEASRDNLETSVLGFEESIAYQIPVYRRTSIYGGFSLAYMSTLEEVYTVNPSGTEEESDSWKSVFEPYVVVGFEYALVNNRSFFVEFSKGSSERKNEIHLRFGLNFFRTKAVEGQGSGVRD